MPDLKEQGPRVLAGKRLKVRAFYPDADCIETAHRNISVLTDTDCEGRQEANA